MRRFLIKLMAKEQRLNHLTQKVDRVAESFAALRTLRSERVSYQTCTRNNINN